MHLFPCRLDGKDYSTTMYTPPHQSVFDKLRGGTVDAIYFYRFQFIVLCEGGNSITACVPFCFGTEAEIVNMEWMEFPIGATPMLRILGSKIVSASTDENHSLRIGFSTGDVLFVAWSSMYESYELNLDGQRLIV